MLKYPFYVYSVSNLSDARYCAGMGVEMIGFCFDPSSDDYVDVATFQGIAGWLSGVKIVAEFGKQPTEDIKYIIDEIKPDFIALADASIAFDTSVPVIYKIDLAKDLKVYPPAGSYLLLENSSLHLSNYYTNFLKKEVAEAYQLIFATGFAKETIDEVYNVYRPYGFAMKGSKEIAPGLKNFDELADILEAIEI